ncbi:hypothetical protein M9194_20470 [Vibrio sp. S4M6]|uniref:hypothetical protein n=1 Tax=Vibrio sinus TaxID=2946865 RepID=UPI00202A1E0E|nr:hypothetical protein [Vibrio sinus]MCL9783804.1 hypothetical protein [Vibrio sinus]
MSSSISVDQSMADLTRQHNELEKLIKEFQSLRGEVQALQSKAQHNPASAEKLAQVQKVLENDVGPKGELIKNAFSDLKKQSLKVQQNFKLPEPEAATSSQGNQAKKPKVRQFI